LTKNLRYRFLVKQIPLWDCRAKLSLLPELHAPSISLEREAKLPELID
jgi:hypothetical protein